MFAADSCQICSPSINHASQPQHPMQSMRCSTGPCRPCTKLAPRQSRHPLEAVGYRVQPLRTTPQDRPGGTEVVTGVCRTGEWAPRSTPQGSSAEPTQRNAFLALPGRSAVQARARAKGRQDCRDGDDSPQTAPKHRLRVLARSPDLFAWAPRTAWMLHGRPPEKGFLRPTNHTGAPQASLKRDPGEEWQAFETLAGSRS